MLLDRLAKRYRRWRHTRGFGIHSPYAYRLLTDSLRPGARYGYYGDTDISAAVEGWRVQTNASGRAAHRLEHRCRLLLRLLAATNPSTLWIDPQLPAPMRSVAEVGGYHPGERLVSDWHKGMMVVVDASEGRRLPADMCRHILLPRRCMLVFDVSQALADTLYSLLPEGLMLRGRRVVWLINRRGMRKLSYTVTL